MLEPGAGGFEAARRALSATGSVPDAVPAVIFRAEGRADVSTAIELARSLGRQLTVRSGGHSLAGSYLRPGAVVVDLRRLNRLAVDPERRLAALGPGLTSAAAAVGLTAAGAAFPVGHSPAVGLGGFLLAGGNGWQLPDGAGAAGCASQRVLAATVLTGDGAVRHVDPQSDPELWWALRGAGSAFPGVVTDVTVRVGPAVGAVHRRGWTIPGTAAAELGSCLDLLEPTESGIELTTMARPAAGGGVITVLATAFAATPAAATHLLGELDAVDSLASGTVTDSSYPSLGELLAGIPDHAGDAQWSQHVWAGHSWLAVLQALPMTLAGPSERSTVLIARAPAGPTDGPEPLYRPTGELGVSAYAHWTPGTDQAAGARSWTHRMLAELGGPDPRRYIGEADPVTDPEDVRRCFPDGTLPRLLRLRRRVDPDAVVASVLDRLG